MIRCITQQKKADRKRSEYNTDVYNGLLGFKLKKITHVIMGVTVISSVLPVAVAGDYFSPNALSVVNGQSVADIQSLDQFSNPGGQMAGVYHVDIFVNEVKVDSKEINFIASENNDQLTPVLTKEELTTWGVKTDSLPKLAALSSEQHIGTISEMIPDAQTKLELNQQRLRISIPQIAMDKTASGTVPESQWENGIPALVLNYYYSGSNTWNRTETKDTNSHYFNLRSGLNIGPWRLKNYSTYTDNSGQRDWKNISTSLERGINFLKSQLVIGDTTTPTEIFDGFQFRGIQLISDESMLPSSLRGFAPIIRGIAQSNAEVTIKQNNYVIYQSYVAPGAFEINDLYPTGTSGDLTVTVKEADGSERSFIVPFSSLAIMQREGQFKYSMTGGKYKSNADEKEPDFVQSTLIYGFPKGLTGYVGGLFSKNYQSYAIGGGVNLGNFGAVSADVTQANTDDLLGRNNQEKGQSYRVQYSKNMLSTGTSLSLANYRYSTEGYYTFSEANSNSNIRYSGKKKNRFQVSISQSLKEFGSIYFSTYQQDYWTRSGKERSINAGYSNSYDGITYNINYSYSDSPYQKKSNNIFSFSISIPLGSGMGSNTLLNSSMTTDNSGKTDAMLGVSGNLLEHNNLNYSVQQSYGNKGTQAGGNAAASYRGGYGIANVGYSYDRNSQRVNYGLNGAVVAHSDGVTLSQPINDSFAIVKAPGADNVRVINRTGVTTDWRGYAVVPYLNAYAKNEIVLDVDTLPDNVELKSNTISAVPTKGAAMLAAYQTHIGYRLLFNVNYAGNPVPFGAIAQLVEDDNQDVSSGIANENGDVYLSGMPKEGRLQVKWGKGAQEQCTGYYQLTAEQLKQHLPVITVNCG